MYISILREQIYRWYEWYSNSGKQIALASDAKKSIIESTSEPEKHVSCLRNLDGGLNTWVMGELEKREKRENEWLVKEGETGNSVSLISVSWPCKCATWVSTVGTNLSVEWAIVASGNKKQDGREVTTVEGQIGLRTKCTSSDYHKWPGLELLLVLSTFESEQKLDYHAWR